MSPFLSFLLLKFAYFYFMGVFASVYHVYVVHMDPLEPDMYATA